MRYNAKVCEKNELLYEDSDVTLEFLINKHAFSINEIEHIRDLKPNEQLRLDLDHYRKITITLG